MNEQVTVFFNG